jgi:uncharacterized protein YerC
MSKTGQRIADELLASVVRGLPPPKAYSSRSAWEEGVWQMLVVRFASLRHPVELAATLNTLITPKQRRELVQRAVALERLFVGTSYRAIGRELWLSPQTISIIKKAVCERRYRSYYERGKTERKKKVYSASHSSAGQRRDPSTYRKRTKYGTLIMPR